MTCTRSITVAIAASLLAMSCFAQPYPSKPIRLLVPFGPGGVGDITSRAVMQKVSENVGQQIIIDNRPSAGGIVATETVAGAVAGRSLADLMYDGFYMVFLLKNKNLPSDAAAFRERVTGFLHDLERAALASVQAEELHLAKYAYCALIDEIVLTSLPRLRDVWERKPLQLQLFGEVLVHLFRAVVCDFQAHGVAPLTL